MCRTVYIVAGEPSGDILASRLMGALRQKDPDIRFAGVGGEAMQGLGFKSLFPIATLSVMGFWEVVPRLPLILKRIRQVLADIHTQQPDVIVTVDSWGFVYSLLKKWKKSGSKIPVVHYVAPQVWAWNRGRAPKVAKVVDRLMTLLPFEPPYFEPYGLRCDFVGHPVVENTAHLTDDIAAFKVQHHIPERCTLLCLLPGSRHSEVKRLTPIFKSVVVRLQTHYPDLFVAIPSVDAIAEEVERSFADMPVPHCIVRGQSERYNAFRACSFAVAASGTVTLELTACGAPHLIAYRFSRFTNLIVKCLITTKFGNLINILANRPIIPEFMGTHCNVNLIYAKALELMRNRVLAQEQVAQARGYFAQLKPEDGMPSERAAAVVIDVCYRPKKEA